ncbi:MAG: hypothetical protein QW512_05310 [Thermofilaceae archaeon]
MAKKRKYSTDSSLKLKGKIKPTVAGNVPGLAPPEVERYSDNKSNLWEGEYKPYHKLWFEIVKPVLLERGIDRTFWGLYRSFAFHVYKLKMKGAKDPELKLIVDSYAVRGLLPDVLTEIYNRLGVGGV